ncbi:MAG: FecR domain-containing protein [Spirochaetales bacterium]|nr:FecR domain-containing protein [Spirochaetales bacterium]
MRSARQFAHTLSILAVCAFMISCPQAKQGPVRAKAFSVEELESGSATAAYTEALVTYASGEVRVKGNTEDEYLEIGSIVHASETIAVGANSMCELQFGENSIVRIEENTEIRLDDFWLEPEKESVDIFLALGTVLCKVSQLSAEESFRIRTPTTACGVRGTEFMVKFTPAADTVLAVQQGKVAVLPHSAEAGKINQEAEIKNPKITALIRKIEDSAPVIESGRQVTIDKDTAEQTERIVNDMKDKIKAIDKKEELSQNELDTVNELIMEAAGKINKTMERPRAVTDDNKEKLKSFERIEIKKLRMKPDKAQDNTVESEPPAKDTKADTPEKRDKTSAKKRSREESIFRVSAQKGWQDTGIQISTGDRVTIDYVSGSWAVAGAVNQTDADGENRETSGPKNYKKGALIGRIGGEDDLFLVGKYLDIESAERSGNLYLRINEPDGVLYDNNGSLKIRIIVEK